MTTNSDLQRLLPQFEAISALALELRAFSLYGKGWLGVIRRELQLWPVAALPEYQLVSSARKRSFEQLRDTIAPLLQFEQDWLGEGRECLVQELQSLGNYAEDALKVSQSLGRWGRELDSSSPPRRQEIVGEMQSAFDRLLQESRANYARYQASRIKLESMFACVRDGMQSFRQLESEGLQPNSLGHSLLVGSYGWALERLLSGTDVALDQGAESLADLEGQWSKIQADLQTVVESGNGLAGVAEAGSNWSGFASWQLLLSDADWRDLIDSVHQSLRGLEGRDPKDLLRPPGLVPRFKWSNEPAGQRVTVDFSCTEYWRWCATVTNLESEDFSTLRDCTVSVSNNDWVDRSRPFVVDRDGSSRYLAATITTIDQNHLSKEMTFGVLFDWETQLEVARVSVKRTGEGGVFYLEIKSLDS